jgi:hypothetical protein
MTPSAPAAAPAAAATPGARPSLLMPVVGTLLASVPFLVLGLFFLDRPAHITLSCEGGAAGSCSLVRSGLFSPGAPLTFPASVLSTATVDRLRSTRDLEKSEYRPYVVVNGRREFLTYRWTKTPEAADALVARLKAFAAAPAPAAAGERAVLGHEDDARRGAARVGGTFTAAGVAAAVVSVLFIRRNRRRAAAVA